MKRITLGLLALAVVVAFLGGCTQQGLISVNLSPRGYYALNVDDSIKITVTTDPEEVDKVELLVDGTVEATIEEGEYIFWWKATEEDTLADLYITAQAWLGEESLESEDTLHVVVKVIVGSPYLPLAEGNTWEYSGTYTYTIDYPEGGPADTTYDFFYSSKMEVVGKRETNWDEPIEVWELKSTVDTFVSYTYIDYDKDYIYYYMDLDETEEAYKIPSKPVLDDEWSITTETVVIDSIVGTDTFTTTYTFTTNYKVVAEGETANGYEKCLKIEVTPENVADYDSYECFDYWAKDVGSVMTTTKWVMTYPYGPEDTYTISSEGEIKLDSFTEGE